MLLSQRTGAPRASNGSAQSRPGVPVAGARPTLTAPGVSGGSTLAGSLSLAPAARGASVVAGARRKAASSSATLDSAEREKLDSGAKAQLLAKVMENIRSRFGDGTLQHLDESNRVSQGIATFSTGCFSLDLALGGGLPRGRLVEVFGPESCGKSTIALHAVAEVQRLGGNAVYIDVENALDARYAQAIGVDVSSKGLVVSQPDSGEQALEIMDELARSHAVDLIIVDSVAALVPRAELEGEIGQTTIGAQARLLSQALKKLCNSAAKSGTCLMFINQIRNKVGVLYGNPEVTSGGNALKYYASVRIDLRKKEVLTSNGVPSGIKVRAKIVKNKVASPHREAFFDITFGKGMDSLAALLDGAEAAEVVTRRGSYYYFGDVRLAQGRDKSLDVLREDPAKRDELEAALRAAIAEGKLAVTAADDDAGLGGADDLPAAADLE